ncbi:hypothetical protein DRH29_00995 [candidate division Kazan bacterium]|uniref:Uncharacterized protein n=1 Tax=candidate division Kazan bacterium TaxID=2202143 RepID=A0A420ZDF9_UNCK3|nr:MAG: hypothetical protein DRH29_00995 [candidate division Kazan bacterium]
MIGNGEIICKVIGFLFLTATLIFVVYVSWYQNKQTQTIPPTPRSDWHPWIQRWINIVVIGLGIAAMLFTLRLQQPVDNWLTTFNGGVWWSWCLIALGLVTAGYGLFRMWSTDGEDDIRLVLSGMALAVVLWILQGHLVIQAGPTIIYPLDGDGSVATSYLAAAKCGIYPEVPRERIYTRPGLEVSGRDEAYLIWTGLGKWVIIGIDAQITDNHKELPSWAASSFNSAKNPRLLTPATNDWLKGMSRLTSEPSLEHFGVEVKSKREPEEEKEVEAKP